MKRVAALLAAVALLVPLTGCGDDGAEPGASEEATLVLDFQPNAVHAGIYAALAEGLYSDRGVDLEVREPSASTDAPKLLAAGRADFAIMDINDVGIARERGAELAVVAPIVQRPLASVIAADADAVKRPRDLAGATVGVTGLPSDEAVLDSVLESDGVDPDSVDRVTIGFEAVPALAAGRIDAATAFWNAEGVALQRQGIDTREFRVDEFGAPRYPELVVVAEQALKEEDPELVDDLRLGIADGYRSVVQEPDAALDALIAQTNGLDRAEQEAQLDALRAVDAFHPAGELVPEHVEAWLNWAGDAGLLKDPATVRPAFGLQTPPSGT
jgi:NitT/TauT family transport system substrate-binding protein/putative hydroxymethylpyrimidine transport system substrate-binding protein